MGSGEKDGVRANRNEIRLPVSPGSPGGFREPTNTWYLKCEGESAQRGRVSFNRDEFELYPSPVGEMD